MVAPFPQCVTGPRGDEDLCCAHGKFKRPRTGGTAGAVTRKDGPSVCSSGYDPSARFDFSGKD
jgi:hypothetical protein